jgi:hypothetical protein
MIVEVKEGVCKVAATKQKALYWVVNKAEALLEMNPDLVEFSFSAMAVGHNTTIGDFIVAAFNNQAIAFRATYKTIVYMEYPVVTSYVFTKKSDSGV